MFTTLVSADELARHLDDPQWIVCDCRHDLTEYEAGPYQSPLEDGMRHFHEFVRRELRPYL